MSEQDHKLASEYLGLFEEQIPPLFRYHLARSGDWQTAETLTAETMRLGRDWYAAAGLDGETPGEWLFGLAATLQDQHRRTKNLPPLTENGLNPTPDQLEQFAGMAVLAESWRKLPAEKADALALKFFGKLNADEVFLLTGQEEEQIVPLVGAWMGAVGELPGLVQPVGYFAGHLANSLREETPRGVKGRPPKRQRRKLRAEPIWRRFRRVAALLVVLFVVAGAALTLWQQVGQERMGGETNRISSEVSFLPSQDQVIFVNETGQLIRLDLASMKQILLTEQKFFSEGAPAQEQVLSASPDGGWLAVVRPADRATYLLKLDGREQIRLTDHPALLDWAPDGRALAFVDPSAPGRLYYYNLESRSPVQLAEFNGEIRAVAWSPVGVPIAVTVEGSIHKDAQRQMVVPVQIETINPQSGNSRLIFEGERDGANPDGAGVLLWTENGDEVWYPPLFLAVPVKGSPPQRLFSLPGDRFGIQTQLLNKTNKSRVGLISVASLSPSRESLVLVHDVTSGPSSPMTLQTGQNFERNGWQQEIGVVETLAWTEEEGSLLAARDQRNFNEILRIDARSGQYQVIVERGLLLGTLSELDSIHQHRAPQVDLAPMSFSSYDGPRVDVPLRPLGISFGLPEGWAADFSLGDESNGWSLITNFRPSDPMGYISMPAEAIMLSVAREPRSLEDWLEDVQNSGGSGKYSVMATGGLTIHRFDYKFSDGEIIQAALIETSAGLIGVYPYSWASATWGDFGRFLASAQIIPQEEGRFQVSDPTSVRWTAYANDDYGLSFEYPAAYDERSEPNCAVRVQDVRAEFNAPYFIPRTDIQVGFRTVVAITDREGLDLNGVVERAIGWREGWMIERRETRLMNGQEGVYVEYRFGETNRLGMMAFFIRGEDAVVVQTSAGAFCDIPVENVTELGAFEHLLETITLEDRP
ncbi:MAG: hypothetical protein JW987_14800 [Anaerolineaceae bacterium]|nr:hypothetical protein [Anaerolineaceae bacterium]